MKKIKICMILIISLLFFTGCSLIDLEYEKINMGVDEDVSYSQLEDVATYIRSYDKLPNNYINKKDAKKLGWDSRAGNLWQVTDSKSIGGDRFMNYEEQLPVKDGRIYYECDIDYEGGYRGKKRLIYSNDGLIYYTEDHYNTFTEILE